MIITVKTAVKLANSAAEASNTQAARRTNYANTEAAPENPNLHNKRRLYCEGMKNKITLVMQRLRRMGVFIDEQRVKRTIYRDIHVNIIF